MWNQLQEQQNRLKAEIIKRDKAIRIQASLKQQLVEAANRKSIYKKQLNKEQRDVDNLDRFSILNTLKGLTGKLDVVREKELAELAAIEAKYREVEKMVVDLEKEIAKVEKELMKAEWQSLDQDWKRIKKEKEHWIFHNDPMLAEKLENSYEEEANMKAIIREIEEALNANREADDALCRALKSLNNAKGYSTWDTFLGGGVLVTAIKHKELNSSEEEIHQAQLALQRFQTELLDLQKIRMNHLMIETDSFITFSDYFFDDIFSAWSVHSKINKAIDRVNETITKLKELSKQLKSLQEQCQQQLQTIETNISRIIEL